MDNSLSNHSNSRMPSIGHGGTHKSNRESEILNEAEIGSYHLVEDIVKELTSTNAKQASL